MCNTTKIYVCLLCHCMNNKHTIYVYALKNGTTALINYVLLTENKVLSDCLPALQTNRVKRSAFSLSVYRTVCAVSETPMHIVNKALTCVVAALKLGFLPVNETETSLLAETIFALTRKFDRSVGENKEEFVWQSTAVLSELTKTVGKLLTTVDLLKIFRLLVYYKHLDATKTLLSNRLFGRLQKSTAAVFCESGTGHGQEELFGYFLSLAKGRNKALQKDGFILLELACSCFRPFYRHSERLQTLVHTDLCQTVIDHSLKRELCPELLSLVTSLVKGFYSEMPLQITVFFHNVFFDSLAKLFSAEVAQKDYEVGLLVAESMYDVLEDSEVVEQIFTYQRDNSTLAELMELVLKKTKTTDRSAASKKTCRVLTKLAVVFWTQVVGKIDWRTLDLTTARQVLTEQTQSWSAIVSSKDPVRIACELFFGKKVGQKEAAKLLLKADRTSANTLAAYMALKSFAGVPLDEAWKNTLEAIDTTNAESQAIERLIAAFSKSFLEDNPDARLSETAVSTLCYNLVLLHTVHHNTNIDQKIEEGTFVRNLQESLSEAISEEELKQFYASFTRKKLVHNRLSNSFLEFRQRAPNIDTTGANSNFWLLACMLKNAYCGWVLETLATLCKASEEPEQNGVFECLAATVVLCAKSGDQETVNTLLTQTCRQLSKRVSLLLSRCDSETECSWLEKVLDKTVGVLYSLKDLAESLIANKLLFLATLKAYLAVRLFPELTSLTVEELAVFISEQKRFPLEKAKELCEKAADSLAAKGVQDVYENVLVKLEEHVFYFNRKTLQVFVLNFLANESESTQQIALLTKLVLLDKECVDCLFVTKTVFACSLLDEEENGRWVDTLNCFSDLQLRSVVFELMERLVLLGANNNTLLVRILSVLQENMPVFDNKLEKLVRSIGKLIFAKQTGENLFPYTKTLSIMTSEKFFQILDLEFVGSTVSFFEKINRKTNSDSVLPFYSALTNLILKTFNETPCYEYSAQLLRSAAIRNVKDFIEVSKHFLKELQVIGERSKVKKVVKDVMKTQVELDAENEHQLKFHKMLVEVFEKL